MMTTKLTQKEMDDNFHDWMTDLVEDTEVEADIRRIVVRDFCETRHVLIVNMLNFFPELIGDERHDEEAQFCAVSKAYPTMVTMQFDEFKDALDFCEDHGMTYSFNLASYNKTRH